MTLDKPNVLVVPLRAREQSNKDSIFGCYLSSVCLIYSEGDFNISNKLLSFKPGIHFTFSWCILEN